MKEKYFHMFGKAVDSEGAEHVVTVVGKFEQFTEKNENVVNMPVILDDSDKIYDGAVIIPYKKTVRNLKLGYSICHPNDTFNEEFGVRLAKSRINRGDYIGELTTTNITMLNDDQCTLNVFGELQYIISNIDKYLPEENNDVEVLDTSNTPNNPYEYDKDIRGYFIENKCKTENLKEAPNFDELPNLN